MFKVGDEVIAVGAPETVRPWQDRKDHNMKPDEVYVVEAVIPFGSWVGLVIAGHPSPSPHFAYSWDSVCFRKVERKSDSLSIEAFLTIKPNQFEGPKRTNQPAKRKEQA